jgi:hypothetical protein
MNQKTSLPFWGILLVIVVAALSRLLPHPINVSPLAAIALFGAASLKNRGLALALPLVAFWLSDLVLNNTLYRGFYDGVTLVHSGMIWTYGAMILIALIGFIALPKVSMTRLVGASLAGSFLFFAVSNFGVWVGGTMYPKTIEGLVACYVAAIPFFQNTVAGDLFYTFAIFGGVAVAQSRHELRHSWSHLRNR